MTRVWFSRGLRGMIAKRIQIDLLRLGCAGKFSEDFVDGDYGPNTEAAVRLLQQKRKLPDTGSLDLMTWQVLTIDTLPSLFQRCLGITADFEGYGFESARGNVDGAGLTWGVIGFKLKNGEIQALLNEAEKRVHDVLARAMGPLAHDWKQIQKLPLAAQIAWADSISVGPDKVDIAPDWKNAFARLGKEPILKYLQMEKAKQAYFLPAAGSAQKLRLRTELGMAFAFDVHVQNGGFNEVLFDQARAFPESLTELERRRHLAELVAGDASTRQQTEVYKRKLTIATGQGEHRGRRYCLPAWGVNESVFG